MVVDLVRDRVAQLLPEKALMNGIFVDPPEEILANKLCALLSRSEPRDLVDVRALENAGYRVEAAVPAAIAKDGGLTPAAIAGDIPVRGDHQLRTWRRHEAVTLIGGISAQLGVQGD